MALWRSMGARKDSIRGTTALEVRQTTDRMWLRPGLMPRSQPTLVTGTAGWAYQVDVAGFVTQNGPADGYHTFGNDGAVSVGASGVGSTVPAAPGGGLSRYDVIWVKQPSSSELGAMDSAPVFGVTSGTAASSPSVPAIPTGALALAQNLMTSTATTTASSGNTLEIIVPWTNLNNCFTVVRNHGERSAMPVASLQRPIFVWCVSHDRFEVSNGGDYMNLSVGVLTGRSLFTVTTEVASGAALTGTITVPALAVPYQVLVVAHGRTGGNGGTRRVAYYYDAIAGGTTAAQDPLDSDTYVLAPTNDRTTVTRTMLITAPAGTDSTFRVRVSSLTGDVLSTGSVTWTRTPQA